MLIELATGEPPNRGMDTAGVLHLIVNGDPFTLPSTSPACVRMCAPCCGLLTPRPRPPTPAYARPQIPFRVGYVTSSHKRLHAIPQR